MSNFTSQEYRYLMLMIASSTPLLMYEEKKGIVYGNSMLKKLGNILFLFLRYVIECSLEVVATKYHQQDYFWFK